MATSCSCGSCPSCLASCENGPVDTIRLAKYLRASDRNGNPRNLTNQANSIPTVSEAGARNSDGSAAQPITLNLQELTQAESVVASTSDGVIGRMTPNPEDGDVLYFGYKDGVVGFYPNVDSNIELDASSVTESGTGSLVIFTCAPGNKLTLAKFIPDCTGRRFLTIEAGIVTCSDEEVGNCPAVDSSDELDSIWGCKDGVMTPIEPESGKVLIGSDDSPSKWTKADATSNMLSVARTSILSHTYTVADIGALISDTINIAALTGYDASYTFALLHFVYRAQTSTSDMTHDVSVDGRKYVGINLVAGSFQGENNQNTALVPIPVSKSWSITNVRSFWQAGSASGNHWIDIYLDGWMK